MTEYSEEIFEGYMLTCSLIRSGNDITAVVYGGDRPHIGSVVMAVPDAEHPGRCTVSAIIRSGHKDQIAAEMFASSLAKKMGCTAVCVCGIHIDNITKDQIEKVLEACRRLLHKI